ncbi:hypothetical protein [Microbacterium sp. Root553]|uniref:hypothetical protein n=1 Tax=Microbacterium sp. Root553 TaxID=1736556 RepID=UPI0006F41695|nr:hypothetical protein [Microbacterium sp. Root553]KQZ23922.1 hypothetical protein ASD43_05810 [Microbacterium sp. Root553]
MSDVATTTGEIVVHADSFDVINVGSRSSDMTRSSGQRFHSGLQNEFSGHKLMGADGLATIVTMRMTRDEADTLSTALGRRLAALKQRQQDKARSAEADVRADHRRAG